MDQIIRNFIWEDKLGGIVGQEVLNLSYEEGGLQLVDIKAKTTVQNIQRIIFLINLEDDNFQKILINNLIGNKSRKDKLIKVKSLRNIS